MKMPEYVNKASVPVADGKLVKHSFRFPHLTTANFMQFGIATAVELIPNQKGRNVHKTFLRCDPLDKPCLGSASIKNRFFFVPYRTCWPAFTDFISDVRHVTYEGSGIIPAVPYIQPHDVVLLFCDDYKYSTLISSDPEEESYNLPFDVADENGFHYRLTNFGRQALKIYEQLGYKYFANTDVLYRPVSALPLLAAAKCYLDWFYPNQYGHIGLYATIDGYFQRDFTYTLSVQEMDNIFTLLAYVPYNSDFLTNVWDNPVAPSDDTGSIDFSIVDLPVYFSDESPSFVEQTTSNAEGLGAGTPVINIKKNVFSQYLDSSLKALTQYIHRHQLSGSRALERYLSEHGIMLTADKLKRCYYLAEDSIPFEISDVMSLADTSSGSNGASLGSYAGKGIAYGEKAVDFNVDEFGMFFCISSIMPDVDYVEGLNRNVMHTTKLDFYHGSFDCLGPAAVSRAEVVCSKTNPDFNNNIQDNVFGFAPRYYEYAVPYSKMTGDFVCNSINTSLFGWSTARLFNVDEMSDNSDIVHSLDFMLGKDAIQFSRIFLGYPVASPDDEFNLVDPFKVIHRDYMEDYSPKKPLFDSYVFEGLEDHNKITMEPNGVKVN